MKKLINRPEDFVDEMLQGIYAAHGEEICCVDGQPRCMVRRHKCKDKVALVTGGGSGHLPLFLGYVGKGMLDGCAIGGVFQSPSADDMLTVTREVDCGKGVLYIIGNYNGDKLNFKLSGESAEMEYDIQTATVVCTDDIASGPVPEAGTIGIRRGVAGIFFVYKCAGAAADEGLSLDEVRDIAEEVNKNVWTMGVALNPCTVPRVGKPSFEIAEDEMEIGMGIHGEPGIRRCKIMSAKDTTEELMHSLLQEGKFSSQDEVAVLINGLGSTPLEEQYIVFSEVQRILHQENIKIYKVFIGEFATSLEMAGLSISLFKLTDKRKKYLDKPADTPFFKQFGKEEAN